MHLSLRGEHNAPQICFEQGGHSYAVKELVRSGSIPSKTSLGIFTEYQAGKISGKSISANLFGIPGLWKNLLELYEDWRQQEFAAQESSRVNTALEYLPPIGEPALMFGLAGNCPMTWRSSSTPIPTFPVGYTRTPHTLTGHRTRVRLPGEVTSFRCAVELGVVIGETAFQISRQQAMHYVAAFTVVNDMISNHWKDFATSHNEAHQPSFHELLITSYYGRGTTGFAPIGPCLASLDEVGNPYDLLMYSSFNGKKMDRSHTNAMVVGIEAALELLSSIMPLPAGSIIHMGTMGLDGITLPSDYRMGDNDYVELEIEKIGNLRTYFQDERIGTR